MQLPPTGHEPVLLDQVRDLLPLPAGGILVDCTLGRAGHASALAQALGPSGLLIGLDVDPENLAFARDRLSDLPCAVRLFHANFTHLDEVLHQAGIPAVDAVLADLGISTNQLFEPRYGLSFSTPMPLDMRIDPRLDWSAADFINRAPEADIANVLYQLAQERHSRRIARKIAEERRREPIKTTERLADIVRSALPRRGGAPEKIDPATRTFLALRMKVNQELENLSRLLEIAPPRLKPNARFAVISFQSMEDRLVKQAFLASEQAGRLTVVTKKPIPPTEAQIAQNPRSRSARLRVARKNA